MSRLAWKRLPDGDRMCTEYPIRLRKPYGQGSREVGWLVEVPTERMPDLPGGWMWSRVYRGDGSGALKGDTYNDARIVVAENLDLVLGQTADDYDGDWIGDGEANAQRQEQIAADIHAAQERHEADRRARRDEYDRPLSAHEQSLVDAMLRLSDMRRQRVTDEVRRRS